MLRSVVLLKQVPADPAAALKSDYTIDSANASKVINPADLSALDMALEWKNNVGGSVICLTMGPASAADCLQEAAMAGADVLYHICDPNIAGADSLVTAQILSRAIQKLGQVDLVLCGTRSTDGETGQVGTELSVMMGFSCLSEVIQIEAIDSDMLRCLCREDDGISRYIVNRPAVLCVCPCRHAEMLPTLACLRRAAKIPIAVLSLAELGLVQFSAKDASPTRVVRVRRMERGSRHVTWLEQDAIQAAAIIRGEIKKYDDGY